MNHTPTSLRGKYLIATPSLGDPRFHRAVVYICDHDADHAMGVVINKAKGELVISDLIEHIGIKGDVTVANTPVLDGGPVDIDRGFVLHSPDYFSNDTSLKLSETLSLTSTKDALEVLVTDRAPHQAVLAVGYAGWSGGQLERELMQNAWLVCHSLAGRHKRRLSTYQTTDAHRLYGHSTHHQFLETPERCPRAETQRLLGL